MVGGKDSKRSKTETSTGNTFGDAALRYSEIPAFMPGGEQRMADQLSMGYGDQPPASFSSYLSNAFSPMSVPMVSRPAELALLMESMGLTPSFSNFSGAKKSSNNDQDKDKDRNRGYGHG